MPLAAARTQINLHHDDLRDTRLDTIAYNCYRIVYLECLIGPIVAPANVTCAQHDTCSSVRSSVQQIRWAASPLVCVPYQFGLLMNIVIIIIVINVVINVVMRCLRWP